MEKNQKDKVSKKFRRDSGNKKSKAKDVVAAINGQEVVVVSCKKNDDNTDEEHILLDKDESTQNAIVIKNTKNSSSENLAPLDYAIETLTTGELKNDKLTNNITVFENTKVEDMAIHEAINIEKATSTEELEATKLKLESEENVTVESGCTKLVGKIHKGIFDFFSNHKRFFKWFFGIFFVLGYFTYFAYALWLNKPGISSLIGLTIFICSIVFLLFISRVFGKKIDAVICSPLRKVSKLKGCVYVKWILYALVITTVLAFIVIDIGFDVKRLTSLAGMATFLFLGFITSKYPSKVKWRPVIWGLGLQLTLAVLILRWSPGFYFFKFLGDQVRAFLEFADCGSKFVFGESGIRDHPMAFQVFPIVIYFSAVINIFYYWGVMQFVVCKIAWLMQFTMGTTAIESLNAACNIFIGMAESCVIMRPFLYKLTRSELHAVMTGGFATVAGSYIALLVQVGAPPEHLVSAAIMSAPAALAMAKLSYPEIEVSHTKTEGDVQMEKAPERNIIQAASNGAIGAIKVVASVAANLIAILGLIEFLNTFLKYLGSMVGVEGFSFEIRTIHQHNSTIIQAICGVIFWPLAVIMGVEIEDASKVASLLGTKIFVDEYISFNKLVEMTKTNQIKDRSKVLATYACCGFGSVAAMGMYIGALTTVAPKRKEDISEVAFRAMINGNVAGFLTACIAGILYDSSSFRSFMINTPGFNVSEGITNFTLLSS